MHSEIHLQLTSNTLHPTFQKPVILPRPKSMQMSPVLSQIMDITLQSSLHFSPYVTF